MRPDVFTEESLEVMFDFIFVRFREAHAVVGVDHGDDLDALSGREDRGDGIDDDGDDAEERDDNMNNAWFAGEPGSTMFSIREGEGHRSGDNVEIAVTDEWGRVKRGVFPCWKRERIGRVEGMGLGNDALRVNELVCAPEEGRWTGHEHDELDCDECLARRRVQRQLDRERAKEEARLIGKNNGEAEGQNDEDEWTDDSGSSSVMSYDPSLDEWDPSYGSDTNPDGNEYPPSPPAHDRTKVARGNCAGIKEIYLVGKVCFLGVSCTNGKSSCLSLSRHPSGTATRSTTSPITAASGCGTDLSRYCASRSMHGTPISEPCSSMGISWVGRILWGIGGLRAWIQDCRGGRGRLR